MRGIDAGDESGGAFLRAEPGFDATPLTTLTNGTLVQILPDSREVEGYFWVHVIVVSNDLEGPGFYRPCSQLQPPNRSGSLIVW